MDRYYWMKEPHYRKADKARQAYLTASDDELDDIIVDMGKQEAPVVMTGQGSFVKKWPK